MITLVLIDGEEYFDGIMGMPLEEDFAPGLPCAHCEQPVDAPCFLITSLALIGETEMVLHLACGYRFMAELGSLLIYLETETKPPWRLRWEGKALPCNRAMTYRKKPSTTKEN